MLYTPMTKKAILLMYSAHEGQTDKSGIPYVFHPYHLAEQMDDELSTVAALLHLRLTERRRKREATVAEGVVGVHLKHVHTYLACFDVVGFACVL